MVGVDFHKSAEDASKSAEQLARERDARIRRRDALREEHRSRLAVIREKRVDDGFEALDEDLFLTNRNRDKKLDYASKAFYRARFVTNSSMDYYPRALVPRDLDEALDFQKHFLRHAMQQRNNMLLVKAWKVGATSDDAQKRRNIQHPIVGPVLDIYSQPEHQDGNTVTYTLNYSQALRPWLSYAECELAFDFNRDFWRIEPKVTSSGNGGDGVTSGNGSGTSDASGNGSGASGNASGTSGTSAIDGITGEQDYSKEEVYNSVSHVTPVIEIVGSRVDDGYVRRYGAPLLQADCGGNVALICGAPLSVSTLQQRLREQASSSSSSASPSSSSSSPMDLLQFCNRQQAELYVNKRRVASGTGAAVTQGWQTDGPLASAQWFINYLTKRGLSLPKGTPISTGTITGKTLIQQRDKEIIADFGPLLGKIIVRLQ